jgi:hypothetical protein
MIPAGTAGPFRGEAYAITDPTTGSYCCALPWRDPQNLRQVSWCDDCLCCLELTVESCLDFIWLGFFAILR